MGAVMIGTFMVALDQTIVTIALPQIGSELQALSGVDWVITGYLLALGVVQPVTGWLADRVGRKRVFLASLALFTTGSLLSAVAPSLPALVGARIIQGLGGGAIFPVGMAMVYEQFPPDRRGMAMGIWTVGIMAAPAIGPTLGGLIVTQLGWRWLFFLNVPIGVVGVIVGARVLHLAGFHEPRPFDVPGFGLVTVGLAALLLAISEANSWGWTALPTLALFAVALVLLALFARHELGQRDPLIDLRMIGIPAFRITLVIVAALVSAQFARLVFIPLELETLRGMSALTVGLVLTPAAFGAAAVAPVAGRLVDRIGARIPVVAGLACIGVAAWLLSRLTLGTSLWAVAGIVTLQGVGNGLAMTPSVVAGMNSLPQRLLARGTALRSTSRQLAGSFSVAALTAIVVAQAGALSPTGTGPSRAVVLHAYNAVFLLIVLVTLIAIGLAALLLPSASEMATHRAARAQEHERLVQQETG